MLLITWDVAVAACQQRFWSESLCPRGQWVGYWRYIANQGTKPAVHREYTPAGARKDCRPSVHLLSFCCIWVSGVLNEQNLPELKDPPPGVGVWGQVGSYT